MPSMVLRSPRLRRRIAWPAAALGVVAAAAVAVVVVPEHDGKPPAEHLRAGAVLPAAEVPLRAADRRAIDRTLDRFVVDAVAKRQPARAGGVVTRGIDPRRVYGYPARGTTFHDWTL